MNDVSSHSLSFLCSHRVLRHTVFICASRSLSVQASASRSSVPPHHSTKEKGSSGTLVFIDVENINTVRATESCPESKNRLSVLKVILNYFPLVFSQSESGVREFHIIQVSSSSQHWRLQDCINPAREKGEWDTMSWAFSCSRNNSAFLSYLQLPIGILSF